MALERNAPSASTRVARELVVLVATVVVVAVTVQLGRWQLRRAAEKQHIAANIEARSRLPELSSVDLASERDPIDRRVRLKGQWVASATVYLDNRQMNGRPGFFVLTPLRDSQANMVVLVQRGWIPRHSSDRTLLAPIATPHGEVSLTGRVVGPPSRLFEFSGAENGPIRQNLDLAAFARETGLPIVTQWSVQQVGEEEPTVSKTIDSPGPAVSQRAPSIEVAAPVSALRRDWPRIDAGVHKHYGYAVQWFGLALLSIVLYGWFRIVRPSLSRRHTGSIHAFERER
jgi:surfeit locus 1 family protein